MTVRELTKLLLAIPEDHKDLPIVTWEAYYDEEDQEGITKGFCIPNAVSYHSSLEILNSEKAGRQPGYVISNFQI